ncbi:MAG: hypothetical protein LLF95_11365 [Bacteroidales bacterium]|nr:hypothetical protein [Bacteroidales bacterium]
MILKEIFYAVKCDRCGAINNETDTAFWGEKSQAVLQCQDDEWLCNVPGKHYCPNCFTTNEENEEVTIKPPFPESVKRIEKFIDVITKNLAEVHEKDDRFEIDFYERISLHQADRNWIVENYPTAKIKEEILRDRKKITITIKK